MAVLWDNRITAHISFHGGALIRLNLINLTKSAIVDYRMGSMERRHGVWTIP